MKSEDTKRIIKEIAKEEGISEWAVRLIVMSQFEAVRGTISKAVYDDITTFQGIRLNAFCCFKVMPTMIKRHIEYNKKHDISKIVKKNDSKKQPK